MMDATAMQNDTRRCTGRFDRASTGWGVELHAHCFGCLRKAVRKTSSHHGFVVSPVTLWVDGVCLGRVRGPGSVQTL